MKKQRYHFLYPVSREYAVDEVCEKIVRELVKRNLQVPGIRVELDEYGSGEQKLRLVRDVAGIDFRLHFCRIQSLLPGGHLNDTAAVTEIIIPKMEIDIFEDESGPTFYLYVGENWEGDREKFMNSDKVNSKLHGEKRMYLLYHGGCLCGRPVPKYPHTHPGFRSPLLLHCNDLDREYDPKRGEPKSFKTEEILEEFRSYLENVVLSQIIASPLPEKQIDFTLPEKAVKFPRNIGPIFCYASYNDADRIKQGKRLWGKKPEPYQRYGMIGSGYRLLTYGEKNDGTVPEIAREGFLWAGLGRIHWFTDPDWLRIPGHFGETQHEPYVLRVRPNRANGIYIVDNAPYEKRRRELAEAITDGRRQYTNDEISDYCCARARTIIPITEYHGQFEDPVVLINRELDLDEVRIVIKPKEKRRKRPIFVFLIKQ